MSIHQDPSLAVIRDDPPEEIKKNVCKKDVCQKNVCCKIVQKYRAEQKKIKGGAEL